MKKMVDKFKKHTDDAKNIMKSFSPNNVLNKSFVNKVNGLINDGYNGYLVTGVDSYHFYCFNHGKKGVDTKDRK